MPRKEASKKAKAPPRRPTTWVSTGAKVAVTLGGGGKAQQRTVWVDASVPEGRRVPHVKTLVKAPGADAARRARFVPLTSTRGGGLNKALLNTGKGLFGLLTDCRKIKDAQTYMQKQETQLMRLGSRMHRRRRKEQRTAEQSAIQSTRGCHVGYLEGLFGQFLSSAWI